MGLVIIIFFLQKIIYSFIFVTTQNANVGACFDRFKHSSRHVGAMVHWIIFLVRSAEQSPPIGRLLIIMFVSMPPRPMISKTVFFYYILLFFFSFYTVLFINQNDSSFFFRIRPFPNNWSCAEFFFHTISFHSVLWLVWILIIGIFQSRKYLKISLFS